MFSRFGARSLAFLLCVIALTHVSSGAEEFYLHDGDRVVFYGDSITEQAHYTLPIETFVATRFPHYRMRFINSGWGGDRAWGGDGGTLAERLERDVINYKPSVVTVMLGMNDGYYTKFDQKSVEAFRKSLGELITTLKAKLGRVKITLIGTSPYDNITPGGQPDWEQVIDGGYDSVVAKYAVAMGEVARENDLLFVDMHMPLVELLTELQAKNPKLARQLIPDRIHPGEAAGLFMAQRLLTAWKAPPREVLEVDAARLRNREASVPFFCPAFFPLNPHDGITNYLLQSDRLPAFSRPLLRIINPADGESVVQVQGLELGQFSASDLARGVELPNELPAEKTGSALAKLIAARARLHYVKWRLLEWPIAEKTEETKRAREELTAARYDLDSLQTEIAGDQRLAVTVRPVTP